MGTKLTKARVETWRPGYHFDSDVKGFGVRVSDTGKRVYFVQYRPWPGGRRVPKKRYTIGEHGSPWTVDAARTEAKRILGLVASKQDPVAERNAERMAQSVNDLCDAYLKACERGEILSRFRRPKRASTIREDRGRIDRHVRPLLGSRRVADVKAQDVRRFIADISNGVTAGDFKTKPRGKARVRGGAGVARRTGEMLGAIFAYAKSERIIAANPVEDVTLPKSDAKERALTKDEYRALGKALDNAGDDINSTAVAAIRLIALTGWRRSEALAAKRADVDPARRAATFAVTKTVRNTRPIGKAALDVLAAQDKRAGVDWYFPASKGKGHLVGLRKPFLAVCEAAGLTGVTPHTLRHSFATLADELGYADATVAAMMGHAARTQTGRYQHPVDSFLVAATDKVAAEIAARMGGGKKGQVIELPRHKRR